MNSLALNGNSAELQARIARLDYLAGRYARLQTRMDLVGTN